MDFIDCDAIFKVTSISRKNVEHRYDFPWREGNKNINDDFLGIFLKVARQQV